MEDTSYYFLMPLLDDLIDIPIIRIIEHSSNGTTVVDIDPLLVFKYANGSEFDQDNVYHDFCYLGVACRWLIDGRVDMKIRGNTRIAANFHNFAKYTPTNYNRPMKQITIRMT